MSSDQPQPPINPDEVSNTDPSPTTRSDSGTVRQQLTARGSTVLEELKDGGVTAAIPMLMRVASSTSISCEGGCGFFAIAGVNNNMCSKCYKQHCVTPAPQAVPLETSLFSLSEPTAPPPPTAAAAPVRTPLPPMAPPPPMPPAPPAPRSPPAAIAAAPPMAAAVAPPPVAVAAASAAAPPPAAAAASSATAAPTAAAAVAAATPEEPDEPLKPLVQTNTSRCWKCRKKIGLTGFQCKCEYFFCAQHRYSDRHEVSGCGSRPEDLWQMLRLAALRALLLTQRSATRPTVPAVPVRFQVHGARAAGGGQPGDRAEEGRLYLRSVAVTAL